MKYGYKHLYRPVYNHKYLSSGELGVDKDAISTLTGIPRPEIRIDWSRMVDHHSGGQE
jgi:hypothetical protein